MITDIQLPEPQESLPGAGVTTSQGLLQWISSVDHKQIGILYLLMALFYLLVGGAMALLMRWQLIVPESQFLGPDTYNQLFTMHGTTMIFFVLTPAILGFSVYLTPLMIGANEMSFPRLNAFSFWIAFFGGLLLYFSFLAGGAPNTGWFNYAPLNQTQYSSTPGVDYYCIGLLLAGIGTVSTAANLIVTIVSLRTPGMSYKHLTIFVWMILINSFLILAAFPSLNAGLVMLLIDRQLDGHFFNTNSGGSALLWQHLFWLFGHPEVYIVVLPPFGILSEVFQVFSRKPIFGYPFVVGSGMAIALLAFGVWVHHMFATGMGNTMNSFFAASSMLIGIPTGVKIFNWLGTMYGGSIRFTTAMLFATAFLVEFTIGGLSGVSFAIVPIDWQLTDTYYVVAHLHYVFLGGSLFGLFSGLFYWFPKITGRMMDETLGRWFFWLFVIGFNLTFFVQHILGVIGMPRRVHTYPNIPGYGSLNLVSTLGALLMGVSMLVFMYLLYKTLKRGKHAPDNPWDAYTQEWLTTSPPALKNFTTLPPVLSFRPLHDLNHPEIGDQKKSEDDKYGTN
ncbi:cytochrome c oxidase subunit I [Spirosoma pollinicola]|uniref:Cytochrome c oxidase subunit 1 n=1 Tax=Spirosoma pollinicola TaxID=2057025 RepID=A0A2K8Z7Q2_9BACT|nr:cytochrome c oxidase subunit I [Spirosoma pollinicola]AUD05880.1 cytochrome c oxidase subunit I [Spirosoma pollinicola]